MLCIGVFGTGIQARLQVLELRSVTPCRRLLAWGRTPENLAVYQEEMEEQGFSVAATQDSAEVAARCNLIVTATPATAPLLTAEMIRPGTHITAMGSDTEYKQELDPAILARADIVVADSIGQCRLRGEISKALAAGLVEEERIVELGSIINGDRPGRSAESQISVADLTGVAVQDIQIATAVCRAIAGGRESGGAP